MIKSLQLSNFQSHKRTKLQFSDGVNLIVGSSNVGKTAILRALKWVVFNRPIGADYLASFADNDTVRVKLELDSGDKIERVRSKNENYYVVNGEKLTAVRSGVPKEVKDLLKLDELNFQFQHDAYFMITDSPANVAKALNRIVGLDEAEKIIKTSKRMYDDKRKELKFVENQELELEQELEVHSSKLEAIQPLFKKLKVKIEEVQTVSTGIKALDSLIESADELQQSLNKISKIVQQKERLDELYATRVRYNEVNTQIKTLEAIVMKIADIEHDLAKLPDLSTAKQKVITAMKILQQQTEVTAKLEKIGKILQTIEQVSTQLQQVETQIKQMSDQFYKESGGVCPVCKQKLPQHS